MQLDLADLIPVKEFKDDAVNFKVVNAWKKFGSLFVPHHLQLLLLFLLLLVLLCLKFGVDLRGIWPLSLHLEQVFGDN
jgi:hypothetical protein